MPVAPTPSRILVRDPLREGTGRIHTICVAPTPRRILFRDPLREGTGRITKQDPCRRHSTAKSCLHAGLRKRSSAASACGALSTYTWLAGHVEPSLNVSLTETY
ncbi:hypothetical protein [Dictyobacter vulcani]|uniref:hypothetical protein n=1 Tax=Dictyobacter vulcani TaxID=2607529 RepID=UPI00124FED55|nr:hypothetical protein [Dictyobacter vulcani]